MLLLIINILKLGIKNHLSLLPSLYLYFFLPYYYILLFKRSLMSTFNNSAIFDTVIKSNCILFEHTRT